MTDIPVVFLERPCVGRPVRIRYQGKDGDTASVTLVQTHPSNPAVFRVATQGGVVCVGPLLSATAAAVATEAAPSPVSGPPSVRLSRPALPVILLAFGIVSVILLLIVALASGPEPGSGPPPVDGLLLNDVRARMERDWGLVFGSPTTVRSWKIIRGSAKDTATGAEVRCELAYYDGGRVWDAAFSVEFDDISAVADYRSLFPAIRELTRRYLCYCAETAYAGSAPSEVRQLVNACVDGGSDAEGYSNAERSIGSATVSIARLPDWISTELNIASVSSLD